MQFKKLVEQDGIAFLALNENRLIQPELIPSFSQCKISGMIEDDGRIIGIGLIQTVGEITIAIQQDESNLRKAKAIKLLFDEGLRRSVQAGIKKWYAFVDNDDWALKIQKHYGFSNIERKNSLALEL